MVLTTITIATLIGKILTEDNLVNAIVGAAGSYVANHIPVLSFLQKHPDFEDEVQRAYENAIEKWCMNDGARTEIYHRIRNTEGLKLYLKGQFPEKEIVMGELMKLWLEELRNNENCRQYVLELKLDNMYDDVCKCVEKLNNIETKVDEIKQILEKFCTKGFITFDKNEKYIERDCIEADGNSSFLPYNPNDEAKHTLYSYVVNGLYDNRNESHFILYSSMQMGKTTELYHLAWRLQQDDLFQPLLILASDISKIRFEDFPKEDTLNGKPFVLIIDAIDEASNGEINDLLKEVKNYATHHPAMRIVLSCRSNFRRDEVISSFAPLYLTSFDSNDVRDYVYSLMPEKANEFLAELNHRHLYDIAKNPQDLNTMIEVYKGNGTFPSSRAELNDLFVKSRFDKEAEKGLIEDPDSVEERKRLENIAAIMLTVGKRTLSKNEFRNLLNRDGRSYYEHRRYNLIQIIGDEVSFVNNNIMEYLAAGALLRADNLNAVKNVICYEGSDVIRPLWYSALLLWVDMFRIKSEQGEKQQLFLETKEWMSRNAKLILLNSDLGLLSQEDKGVLYISVLEECKSEGSIFNGVADDLGISKISLPENLVRYLINEWRNIQKADAHLKNIERLTKCLDWDSLFKQNSMLATQFEDCLIDCLKNPFFKGDGRGWLYSALGSMHFMKMSFTKRIKSITDIYGCKEDQQALILRMGCLEADTDEFIDFLLDAIDTYTDRNAVSNNGTIYRDHLYYALRKIQKPENIFRVLEAISKGSYWNYYDTKNIAAETALKLIDKASAHVSNEEQKLILDNAKSSYEDHTRTFEIPKQTEEQRRASIENIRKEREDLCKPGWFVDTCRSILSYPYGGEHEPADIFKLLNPYAPGNKRGEVNRYIIEFLQQYVIRNNDTNRFESIVDEDSARTALNEGKPYERFRFHALRNIAHNGYNPIPLTDAQNEIYHSYAVNRLHEILHNPIIANLGETNRVVLEMLLTGEITMQLTQEECLNLLYYAGINIGVSIDNLDEVDGGIIFSYVSRYIDLDVICEKLFTIVSTHIGESRFRNYYTIADYLISRCYQPAVQFFYNRIMLGDWDSEELLTSFIRHNCNVSVLQESAKNMIPELKLVMCQQLMLDAKYHDWILQQLGPIYCDYRQPMMLDRIQMLVKLGNIETLRLILGNHHLLHPKRDYDFQYSSNEAIPLLGRLCNLVVSKNQFNFMHTFTSVLQSLWNIGLKDKDCLEEVKKLILDEHPVIRSFGNGYYNHKIWIRRLEACSFEEKQRHLSLAEATEIVHKIA